jgi:hypothetical protein
MAEQQQLETGSPFAAEFDARLKSDAPLIDVVRWWERITYSHLSTYVSSLEAINSLSDAESAAYLLTMYEDWDTYVIDPVRAADPYFESQDRIMRDLWTQLENARAWLQTEC